MCVKLFWGDKLVRIQMKKNVIGSICISYEMTAMVYLSKIIQYCLSAEKCMWRESISFCCEHFKICTIVEILIDSFSLMTKKKKATYNT